MVPLVEQNLASIQIVCDRSEVRYLDLVGSGASGSFDATRSDLDFLVDFKPSTTLRRADQYFDLQFGLEDLMQRPIDLIEEAALRNHIIVANMREHRERIYGW